MDILAVMCGMEGNPWRNTSLVGDVCFIEEQEAHCIRIRSATGHPHRPKYWWVVKGDITVLSKGEVS